jgi:hypothetical protein
MEKVTCKKKVCVFLHSLLLFNARGLSFNKICASAEKKYFLLRAQTQMHRIFHFLHFRKMNLPSRTFRGPNMWKSLGTKCILYGGCSSSSSFKSRLVLSVLLAVCGRAFSCCSITVGDDGLLASCIYWHRFVS